jgi:hypothetical protein
MLHSILQAMLKMLINSSGCLDQISPLLLSNQRCCLQLHHQVLGNRRKLLCKGAYRLAQQIQFITDSTVLGGKQLLQGNFIQANGLLAIMPITT